MLFSRYKTILTLWFAIATLFSTQSKAESGLGVLDTAKLMFNAGKNKVQSFQSDMLLDAGMWRDPKTNLIWMRCSLGQAWSGGVCTGQAKTYSWDEARVAVRKLNRNGGFGGYTDWELPHIEDLVTIRYCSTGFEYGYTADIPTKAGGIKTIPQTCKGGTNGTYQRPTIDQRIFPNTPNTFVESYWSASPIAADDYSAWSLSFYFGYTFNDGNVKRAQQFVRAVRAAQ